MGNNNKPIWQRALMKNNAPKMPMGKMNMGGKIGLGLTGLSSLDQFLTGLTAGHPGEYADKVDRFMANLPPSTQQSMESFNVASQPSGVVGAAEMIGGLGARVGIPAMATLARGASAANPYALTLGALMLGSPAGEPNNRYAQYPTDTDPEVSKAAYLIDSNNMSRNDPRAKRALERAEQRDIANRFLSDVSKGIKTGGTAHAPSRYVNPIQNLEDLDTNNARFAAFEKYFNKLPPQVQDYVRSRMTSGTDNPLYKRSNQTLRNSLFSD